jgi:signal transduction histidine kinase
VDLDRLAETARLATLGDLARTIAHEMNNPLFGILGLLELALASEPPGTKIHGRLTLMQETAVELKELVRALQEYARGSLLETATLDDACRAAVSFVRKTAAAKGVTVTEVYPPSPQPVAAAPMHLLQVLVALLVRAHGAAGDAGEVRIEVRAEGPTVVAAVTATGGEAQPITDDFVLGVSEQLVAAAGGTLTYTDDSSFTLTLPLAESTA